MPVIEVTRTGEITRKCRYIRPEVDGKSQLQADIARSILNLRQKYIYLYTSIT